MSFIGDKLLEHARALARLDRQAVTQRISGKVAQRDFAKRRLRLELGEDPATGKKVLSPWVRVQSQSAGAHRTFVMPSIGEQMTLESEGGRVGANSVARYGTHDDEHKHPDSDPDEWVHTVGNATLKLKDNRFQADIDDAQLRIVGGEAKLQVSNAIARLRPNAINLVLGGSEIVITTGAINIKSPLVLVEGAQLIHNAKNVGDTHTNSGLPVD